MAKEVGSCWSKLEARGDVLAIAPGEEFGNQCNPVGVERYILCHSKTHTPRWGRASEVMTLKDHRTGGCSCTKIISTDPTGEIWDTWIQSRETT